MRSDSRGDTLKRITKAALGGLAGCALVLGATQLASGESAVLEYNYTWENKDVVDLRPGEATPTEPHATTFDAAFGSLRIKVTPEAITSFKLRIEGVETSSVIDGVATSTVGTTFGAHLHTDPCDVATPSTATQPGGPHYNHDSVLGTDPIEINTNTEAWFNLVPNANGVAIADIAAPFVPDDSILSLRTNQILGDMSVVIHERATNPLTGGAGLRQVCLPLKVSQWNPAPSE
jgi:hypothetical protein